MSQKNRERRQANRVEREGARVVVKIQRPLGGNMEPHALVYDETRALEVMAPWNDDLEKLFGDRLKIYVEADVAVIDGALVVQPVREVEEQPW